MQNSRSLKEAFDFCFDLEDISSTRDSVSSAIQTHRILSKVLRCASSFQLFSVFGYPDETLLLVFDILLTQYSEICDRKHKRLLVVNYQAKTRL